MPDTPLPTEAPPEMAPSPEPVPEAQAPATPAVEPTEPTELRAVPALESAAEPAAELMVEPAAEPAAEALAGAVDEAASAPADAPVAASEPAPPELTLSQCAARLAELFPALFAPPVKPIKLRIQADLQARAPGAFSRRVLSVFLHRHTTSTAYIKALVHLGHRFDLDGQPAGEIAAEHREAAVAELARRREIMEKRREAERQTQREARRETEKAERAAYQQAQQQAQQAQQERQAQERQRREAFAAQDGERRERIALLRAWEGSTLTRANFCALKRIDESTLQAQLALAREDLAQRAAMPRPDAQEPRPQQQQPAPGDARGPRRGGRPDQRAPRAPRAQGGGGGGRGSSGGEPQA